MALVERLMGLAADGVSPSPDCATNSSACKIPVHAFFSAQAEVIRGGLTVAQVKSFLNMDVATATEYDTLVATAPTGNTATALANKALFVEKIHAIFILAEGRYPQYSTPAEVRTKLGI
jgi:hypothetical protein